MPWTLGIARFQVLADVRGRDRDKYLLDSELVAALSNETERQVDQLESMRIALRQCVSDLLPVNCEMIHLCYFRSTPINEIARSMGRGADAVKVALLSIRRGLADCFHHRILQGKL
ncbi:MAG: RNA polymerase subunit sigma-70 [Rubripirellula sp.]|nr:RNA polymerase subunit sigma-70 [Rubripirellula sp.]